jgi:hypothetical protein
MPEVSVVLSYRHRSGFDVSACAREALRAALLSSYDEFDSDEVSGYVNVPFVRVSDEEALADDGTPFHWAVAGIQLVLPPDVTTNQLADDFCAALHDADDDTHVVKFEDESLYQELALFRREIYEIEMKLRRVLSVVYLRDRHRRDPYRLLCDDRVSAARDLPQREQLKRAAENELFYVSFSQYQSLNQPSEPKTSELLERISTARSFEELQLSLAVTPIAHEADAAVIAGLVTRMESIEAVRNCVAHNRRPSKRAMENYRQALPDLNELLDDFLRRCASA